MSAKLTLEMSRRRAREEDEGVNLTAEEVQLQGQEQRLSRPIEDHAQYWEWFNPYADNDQRALI